MINDRFTSQVLGAVTIVMAFLIDVSFFIFTAPEIRHQPTFPLVVIVPSLPLFAAGVWLIRRGSRMKQK